MRTIMSKSQASEYLEKYSVAPSPSRDYYGVKVINDQVILYTWKISHGPHKNPIVRISTFSDFNQDKSMHGEIQRVFGESTLRHIQTITHGRENSLVTLPKHVIKKITTYLTFKDVTKLCRISRIANEIFDSDIVWEVLYKRHRMGLICKDERVQGGSYGWKRLFMERQMHKPARERKAQKKLTAVRELNAFRSPVTSKSKTGLTPRKNREEMLSKSSQSFCGKTDSENDRNNNAVKKGKKLLSDKLITAFSSHRIKAAKQEEPKKVFSVANSARGKIFTKNFNEKVVGDQRHVASSFRHAKNSKQKSDISCVTKFSKLESKSSSESARRMKSAESSTPRLVQRITSTNSKNRAGKSAVIENMAKTPFNESHRVSLQNYKVVTEEFGRGNVFVNSDWESDTNSTQSSLSIKLSECNLPECKNEFAISKKCSSLKRPETAEKSMTKKPEARAASKKLADIKVYRECKNENFCKKVNNQNEVTYKTCNQTIKREKSTNETVTKYQNRNFLQNGS